MLANLHVIAGLVALLIVVSFAFWKGDAPERLTAVLVLFAWLAPVSAQVIFGEEIPIYVLLAADGFLAAGLLIISIRYASVWLGAAMLLQSLSFALHSQVLSSERPDVLHYIVVINALSYSVLLTLALATLIAWRRRAKRREQALAKTAPAELDSAGLVPH